MEESCEIEKLPTLPYTISVRVAIDHADMAFSEEYKHCKKKIDCQFCAILVVWLIAIICLAVGTPMLSTNENDTESWEFALVFAVAMMFMGVVMFIIGLVSLRKKLK